MAEDVLDAALSCIFDLYSAMPWPTFFPVFTPPETVFATPTMSTGEAATRATKLAKMMLYLTMLSV